MMKGKIKSNLTDLRGSLLVRMIALFGLVVLLGCLSLFLVSEWQAGSALQSAAEEALLQLAKQTAEIVDSRIQARLYVVQSTAERNVIRGKAGDRAATREEQLQALREDLQRAESLGFKDMGIADRSGNAFFASGKTASAAGRDYFEAALSGKTAVSSSIVSKLDGSVVFVYAAPIRHYASGEISGVLIGVVDGVKFSELVKSITYGRTGYGFAVDSTGKIIAHKDEKLVLEQKNFIEEARSDQSLSSLASMIGQMTRGNTGITKYTYLGQEKVAAYAPIKSTGWSLGINVPKAEALARVSSLKQLLVLVSLLVILLALGLTIVIARGIARPVALAVDHLGLIAGGDFTRPVHEGFLRRRDEIGLLARAIEQLQARLKPVLAGLADEAQTLAANSEELAASAQQVSATVQEVAGTSSEVAAMAEKSLENAVHAVGESRKVVELAESGGETLKRTIDKVNSIAQSSAQMGQSIQSLGELSGRIGNITSIITGIADQTNLLALNAAIEAARAGEQGRGFAVVAEEVRKLAEQSASAAREIDQLIQQIQASVQTTVQKMELGSSEVQQGVELASQAGVALNSIIDAIGRNIALVEEISSGARQTSEGMQQLAASNEQVTSTIQQVAGATQQLAEIAARLQSAVAGFKL